MSETSNLKLTWRSLPVFSLAAQQNAYKLFADLRLYYQSVESDVVDETSKIELPDLRDLTVTLECESDLLVPEH